jgi:maleate isomerase
MPSSSPAPICDILRDAETAIGAPVISSNQALAWHMLRLAGIDDKSPAFGKLFET